MKDLITAVMASCNLNHDEAWEEIKACRQNFEENITCDPERYNEYIEWALQDLGLETDYALEFLDVPHEPVEVEDEESAADLADEVFNNLFKE